MNKNELLQLFKDNLVKFMTALSERYNEPDFHVLRVFFSVEIPIEEAMIVFSERILPHSKMVEEKDGKFFLECGDLFEGIQRDKVHYFKNLWLSSDLTEDDRETLWKWFRLFLKLAQKYRSLCPQK